jgi:serine O-acetyltransferase
MKTPNTQHPTPNTQHPTLKNIIYRTFILVSSIRLIHHFVVYNVHHKKNIIQYDVEKWLENMGLNKEYGIQFGFLFLMTFVKEYRNLYYNRIGHISIILKYLCKPMNTLFINTREIGPGLFIQHGFSTIITAKSIGKDCWINQQVTIGYSNKTDCPIIGDNVTINAGAKVIGKVIIGKNSRVGANAVVVKNVPENCTVVGVPAYIVRKNGIKTRETL